MSYDLDPFKKELFFAKSKSGKVDLITGRDGYLTIVQRDSRYIGLQSMEVYSKDEFTIEYETGEEMQVHHKILDINPAERGDLIGAWATCRFKGRDDATVFVYMDEYKKMGYDNWKNYPSAMITKVAQSIVMKRQGGISGLVTQEEIGITPESAQLLPPKQVENTPVDIPTEPKPDEQKHPGPKDVTDLYNRADSTTEPPEVIQTSQGAMFNEYQVGEFEVVESTDTGEITCRTCKSTDCEHVVKVKQYLGAE